MSTPSVPEATIYYQRSGPGGSASVLLGYSDGIKRATKLIGNPQEGQGAAKQSVLVNELVVASLAQKIGAPCPRGDVVLVGDVILQAAKGDVPELAAARAGLCFGSEWVEECSANPGEDICRQAANRSALAGLVVLYTWTLNTDLKGEHLLWRVLPNGVKEVIGVDHGHCFGNQWDASIRDRASSMSLIVLPELQAVLVASDYEPFLARVEGLTADDLRGCVEAIPPEWGASADETEALIDFLDGSRLQLPSIIGQT